MLETLLGARKNVKGMMKGVWKEKEALAKWLADDDDADWWQDLQAAKGVDQEKYVWIASFKDRVTTEELARLKLLYAVLDGRQLALKLVCNSTVTAYSPFQLLPPHLSLQYGFLKGHVLAMKDIMSAVTSWGREMLTATKRVVEEHYSDMRVEVDRAKCAKLEISPKWNPQEGQDPRPWKGAYVVYGDTGPHFSLQSSGPGRLFSCFLTLLPPDSVMVNFGDISLDECKRLGEECSAIATREFVKPNLLEFESIKIRSLFLNKKRYASLELEGYRTGEGHESACRRAKLNCKGLESKRRDNARIGSDTQKEVLEMVLRHGDVVGAERYVRGVLRDIMMDRVDMSKYVITKGLSKTAEQYAKGGTKQQHVAVTDKKRARSHRTGESVAQTGDRVPYVMISGLAGDKAYQCAEDPIYAQKEGAPIDKDYYITKQVGAATLRTFTGIWAPEQCGEVTSNLVRAPKRPKIGKTYLDDLVAWQRLFAPHLPHMMAKKKRKAGSYAIGRFTEAIPHCLQCRGGLSREDAESPLCLGCLKHEAELKARMTADMAARKKRRDDAWERCRVCQGGGGGALLECSNLICDNFFHRNVATTDVEDLGADLERFNSAYRPSKRDEARCVQITPRPRKRERRGTIESFFAPSSSSASRSNGKRRKMDQ